MAVILSCLFIALFVLYTLANDDFVLLRKNIIIIKIFDIAILTLGFGLFAARLFYVVFHFTPGFLNPLVFFLFPYFPGLSLGGGIIGGILFLVAYSYKAKLAVGRIFDIFSLSLFSVLPVGLLMQILIIKKNVFPLLVLLLGAVLSAFVFILLLRNFQKGNLKDGSIGLLSFTLFSFITFLTGLVGKKDILLVIIFLVSTVLFIRQEKLYLKIKNPFLS